MNALAAYQQQKASPVWTRIDMLLALFNGAIERGEKALLAIAQGQQEEESRLRAKARMIVAGLAVSVDRTGELANNFLSLYQFSMHKLAEGGTENIQAALKVLRTLREGFEQIRPEAVELERTGHIPPLETGSAIQLLA